MKKLLITISWFMLLSCVQQEFAYIGQIPSYAYPQSEVELNTKKVKLVDIPIKFEETSILIHPVVWETIRPDRHDGIIDILTSDEPNQGYSFYVKTNGIDYIAGSMSNLVFENLRNGKKTYLTDKEINIVYVSYLKDMSQLTNSNYLIYRVYDMDYNNDGILDEKDQAAYYISYLDGSNFTKIGDFYCYFDDSREAFDTKKYYFRVIEDLDKNGYIDEKDKYRYFYIDFATKPFKIVEYNPLDFDL